MPSVHADDRFQRLKKTGLFLGRLSPLVTYGIWALGVGLFLDQSRDLLSDAQFTWGERQIMTIVAIVTVGGCILAGLVCGRLFRAAADMIELFVDLGDSSRRTGDLIERHVIPLLGRIATNLEARSTSGRDVPAPRPIVPGTSSHSRPSDSIER